MKTLTVPHVAGIALLGTDMLEFDMLGIDMPSAGGPGPNGPDADGPYPMVVAAENPPMMHADRLMAHTVLWSRLDRGRMQTDREADNPGD